MLVDPGVALVGYLCDEWQVGTTEAVRAFPVSAVVSVNAGQGDVAPRLSFITRLWPDGPADTTHAALVGWFVLRLVATLIGREAALGTAMLTVFDGGVVPLLPPLPPDR